MKPVRHRIVASTVSALVGIFLGRVALAQDVTPLSLVPALSTTGTFASELSSIFNQYQQERQVLMGSWQALVSQGATEEQEQGWRQQNSAALALQQQRAEIISAAGYFQPLPVVSTLSIPPNVSGMMRDYFTTRITLLNARAQLHNSLIQSLDPSSTPAQVSQFRQQEEQAFQQQYAAELQLQYQRIQTLSASAVRQPIDASIPSIIPPNASTGLQAYIALRDALRASWVQMWNQNVNSSSTALQAAIAQWRMGNAAKLQQLQELVSQPATIIQQGSTQ